MEDVHLKLFLTEDLYLLPDDQKQVIESPKDVAAPSPVIDEKSTSKVETEASASRAQEPALVQEEVIKYPIIVVSESLSKEEKELMDKILMAVNVKPNQVHHIVGQPQSSLSYDKLIVFGDFEIEGVDGEYYNVTRTTQMSLRARPLSSVNGSREEKTKLWNSLKTWFGL